LQNIKEDDDNKKTCKKGSWFFTKILVSLLQFKLFI